MPGLSRVVDALHRPPMAWLRTGGSGGTTRSGRISPLLLAALLLGLAACTANSSPPAASTPATTGASPAAPATTRAPIQPTVGTTAPASPVAGQPAVSPPAATAPSQGAPQPSRRAEGEPIKVGQMCDRSGVTVNIGSKLCDAYQNWVEMVNNSQRGIKGRPVEALEIDHKYEVPLAVDAYKKYVTRDKVPQILAYGTPMADALIPSAGQDQVVLWTPGFGLSPTADGQKFPYIFVGVATYYAQSMAILDYLRQEWQAEGQGRPARIVYLYLDNPAGRDPIEVLQQETPALGLELVDTVAVPATTVDLTSVMQTIKDKNPDFIVTQMAGRLPALSIQAAHKVGFPREKLISFPWGMSEDEIEIAQANAEGYRGLQFTALSTDNPEAYQLLEAYWQGTGQQPNPKRTSVYYARGLMAADIMLEALRQADNPESGESVKAGAERIRDFRAHGMIPGTTLTAADHGGTRQVRMYQVRDGKLVQIKDWFEGPRARVE